MASKTLLCVLLCALIVPSVEGIDNKVVCACRCCYSGFDCHPFTNGTFQIDSCSECTSGKCEARAATATTLGCTGESRYVISECYNRDAFFPKLTCFILLGLLTGLVVFGMAKDHIPALASFSSRHFNY